MVTFTLYRGERDTGRGVLLGGSTSLRGRDACHPRRRGCLLRQQPAEVAHSAPSEADDSDDPERAVQWDGFRRTPRAVCACRHEERVLQVPLDVVLDEPLVRGPVDVVAGELVLHHDPLLGGEVVDHVRAEEVEEPADLGRRHPERAQQVWYSMPYAYEAATLVAPTAAQTYLFADADHPTPAAEVARAEQEFFPDVDSGVLTQTIAYYQQLGCWNPSVTISRATYEAALDVFLHARLITKLTTCELPRGLTTAA